MLGAKQDTGRRKRSISPADTIDLDNAEVRLVTGWRKDGGVFPVELTISEVRLKDRCIYTGIIRDVTERTKLDKMKREFVSVVGHELRTPLTSIQGSLALLNSHVVGELPPRAKSMVKIGLENSERLLRLIGDILDMEKIESGQDGVRFRAGSGSARCLSGRSRPIAPLSTNSARGSRSSTCGIGPSWSTATATG